MTEGGGSKITKSWSCEPKSTWLEEETGRFITHKKTSWASTQAGSTVHAELRPTCACSSLLVTTSTTSIGDVAGLYRLLPYTVNGRQAYRHLRLPRLRLTYGDPDDRSITKWRIMAEVGSGNGVEIWSQAGSHATAPSDATWGQIEVKCHDGSCAKAMIEHDGDDFAALDGSRQSVQFR